jgi:hypothetical protein
MLVRSSTFITSTTGTSVDCTCERSGARGRAGQVRLVAMRACWLGVRERTCEKYLDWCSSRGSCA